MKLYLQDIERVATALRVHEATVNKSGGCEFFKIVVKDSKGNPIGSVENDKYGKSCFKEIGR